MCGITGFVTHSFSSKNHENNIIRSIETLKKRGPDHQSYELFERAGLGHTRLSIIDLTSHANQPITDNSGRYSIVFNGEILNYKDLRKELGLPDNVTSDTEVLLYSYMKWKEDCLEKLNGFFAFVIYDKLEHSVFMARDRFGIKPLLYSISGNTLFFASELKALLAYPIPRIISNDALSSFFRLSYIPQSLSIYDNIHKIQPGEFAIYQGTDLKRSYYYQIPRSVQHIDYQEAQTLLREKFDQAVDYWITSDTPIGAFLSGGVDSSVVVALAAAKTKNLKTFSVSFPDSPFHDESIYAREVAERYNTSHTEIPITQNDLYSYVDEVLNYLDEPFADSSAIPSYALCAKVSKDVKVSLSGDGADEIFGGYEKYRGAYLSRKFQKLSPLARLVNPALKSLPMSRDSFLLNKIRKISRFNNGLSMNAEQRYWSWSSFNSEEVVKELLQNSIYKANWNRNIFDKKLENFNDLNDILWRDSKMVLAGDMLTKVDMTSMANSLEVRPLFLEHNIVNFAFSLPDHYKIDNVLKKRILIDSFKSLLPQRVYNRPKQGFSVELLPFFKNKYWEKINDLYLSDKLIKEQEIFNLRSIQNLKKNLKSGKAEDMQALLWSLIVFQNFYLKYGRN